MERSWPNLVISFLLAAAPALLLLRYYYRQDRERPEPKGLVVRIFLFGIVATFVAIPLELLMSVFQRLFTDFPLLTALFKAFVVAALVEEYLKLTIVRLFAYRNRNFDEIMDGVVYAVVASLGFACMENILYVLGGTIWTALTRAVTAIPLHATASGLMGYYVGRAKFAPSPQMERASINKGLRIAIFIHGTYDFLLFSVPVLGTLPVVGIIPLIIIAFLILRSRIRIALEEDGRRAQFDQLV
ncbi:MAG: PrsW family intramembrane metalloprotease [Spirochaetaceae bacterium]|nr:MAG: PrsW family intramembrane metalloprotease [Spirochaetaceae bacterium]